MKAWPKRRLVRPCAASGRAWDAKLFAACSVRSLAAASAAERHRGGLSMYTLYGSDGSGSASVEIALLRCGAPFRIVRAASWEPGPGLDELAIVNPLKQIPTLRLPDGGVLS